MLILSFYLDYAWYSLICTEIDKRGLEFKAMMKRRVFLGILKLPSRKLQLQRGSAELTKVLQQSFSMVTYQLCWLRSDLIIQTVFDMFTFELLLSVQKWALNLIENITVDRQEVSQKQSMKKIITYIFKKDSINLKSVYLRS